MEDRITISPIKIIDEIHHKNKYGTQVFHVVDRMPKFLYERDGNWLIGEDSGLFNFYFYDAPAKGFEAFAGRKFTIPLKKGGTVEATGQWWDGLQPDYRGLLVSVGIGTPEKLGRCNVFTGMWIDPHIIRHSIKPSNNYNKYAKRHSDYGKHEIKSRWED